MADQISHITPEQIAQYGVVAAPDVLRGSPGDNKAIFDRLVRELVAVAVNQIIDETNVLLLSEDVRQAQEEARQAGENGRVSTEETRAAAEDTRENQEEARETAEQGRVSAEEARVQAETARAAAEGSREGAESARVLAETARETSAQQMESALETAEQARETAEQGRVSAEAARNVWEPYDPGKDYAPGNKVSSGGSSYLCKVSVRGIAPPDPAYWILIAAKGLDGTGAGDMLAAVYDPAGKARDVFAYADAAEAAAKADSRPSTWTPTPAEIGAAEVAHTHPASDLSTVVPVTGGGTGAEDAAGARENLGACADQLADETAEILGLDPADDPTVNDGLAKLATGLPLKLIAEYKQAGTYTWTVPEGITKVTVAMIGGGGSGAAGFDGHQYGGASGRAAILENYSVTPGDTIAIVVGKGGTAASVTTGNSSNGNSGNTTAFDGHTAPGGQGGGAYGASGGQFAAISGYFQSYFSSNQEAALYSGRELSVAAYGSTTVNVFSLSPGVFDRMLSIGILPFCLCAGNPAYASGNSSLLCGPLILPNGNNSGYSSSQYSSNYVDATAGKGTDPGCGGGAATVLSSSGRATSAAGCDGGVFIYVKGGQQ